MRSSKPIQNLGRFLLGVLISIIAIIILLYKVDWSQVLLAFENFDWRIVPQFMIAYLVSAAARAMASRKLLENRPTVAQSFTSLAEGYLLNNLFPFRLGDLGRAYLLSRKSGISMIQVLSANVIERIIDLILAAGLLISTFPLIFEMAWIRPVAYITFAIMISALISLFLILRFRNAVHAFMEHRLSQSSYLSNLILPRLYSALDGLSALGNLRDLAIIQLWMLASWFFNILAFMVVLKNFFPSAHFYWAVFIVGVVSFAAAIPSAPAAIGVLEGAVVVALTFLGMPSGPALAYGVALHFLAIMMTTILGVFSLSRETESIWKIYERLISQREDMAKG